MLPELLSPHPEENSSIIIRECIGPNFENPAYSHPDIELNLILKSNGVRFVGDHIDIFKEDDLVLLGPKIPHSWRNDSFFDQESKPEAQAIVIRFNEYFLGKDQYKLRELNKLRELFKRAERGLLICGKGKERIIASIFKMKEYQGMERLIIFLGILNAIMNTCDLITLSTEGFMSSLTTKYRERMNKVYGFVTANFRSKISLDQMAAEVNMNTSAFSRYFSQVTGKSVTEFLQELRLGYACKLLTDTDLNVSEVMLEAGFNNQAYFNKLFFERKGMAPKDFRKEYS